jgi:integral membrane sensor domain MASE1
MRSRPLANIALQLGTAGVYFAGATAGLALASLVPQVTLIWPPTGIALADVLLFGLPVWPAIALGAFLANVTTQEPVLTAAGIALGNTLEAVAGGGCCGASAFAPGSGACETPRPSWCSARASAR